MYLDALTALQYGDGYKRERQHAVRCAADARHWQGARQQGMTGRERWMTQSGVRGFYSRRRVGTAYVRRCRELRRGAKRQ